MAVDMAKWFFLLCLLIVILILIVVRLMSVLPVKTSPLIQAPAVLPKAAPVNLKPTKDECPCPRDLEGMTVKDISTELETDMDVLIGFFQRGGLKAQKGLGRRREALDPEFEVPLMRYAPPQHAVCLPDHARSKVRLLTPSDQLSVGSPVQLRVDIYNGCGQPRFTGGDEIRVWLKSKDGYSSVAAKVKDLHNGSYVADTVLPWPGVTFVRVSLTYAQEFLRFCVELYHSVHSTLYTLEILRSGNITERVPCLPSPPIPGYADTCNFTAANGDRPWFCGRPLHSRLDCGHRGTYDSSLNLTDNRPIPQPLRRYVQHLHADSGGDKDVGGAVEEELRVALDQLQQGKKCCESETADLRLIPNSITLEVPSEKAPPGGPLPPCYSRPVKESWVTASPKGWLRHGHWLPSTCTLPPLSQDRVHRCLRNRTLLLIGDSNQRVMWEGITTLSGCSRRNVSAWNAPRLCQNDDLRSTILAVTHAFPFAPGNRGPYPVVNLPLPMALEASRHVAYPSNPDVTVLIHYYMHLSIYPVHVYRTFVQAARKTVQKYLKVHPTVRFLIQGPHALFGGRKRHTHIGDKFAHWYQRLWREEFAELSDRVWYLDTWDLTIASENLSCHPFPVMSEIIRIVFGVMCDV